MWIEAAIAAAKALFIILMVFQIAGVLGWVERKGSALIQDRIGANRASIFGFAGAGLINTLLADPVKFLTKEDVIPRGADRLLHTLAPCITILPALVAFAVIPFGNALVLPSGGEINLQVARLDVGILYLLAMVSLGVYGIALGGWASNNRWSLLGAIRGAAQMISYEIAMGLTIVSMVLTYGTLDLQTMVHAQGKLLFGFLPAWGIFYQPLACLLFLTAGIAESKRTPFDLPECESELISGYFTEYSGVKHLMFFMTDLVEVIIVSGLIATMFLGGWQIPYVASDGSLLVTVLQVVAFFLKVFILCWFQIMIRWTLPRFRYDQLMRLGWKGLLPLGLANVAVTAVLAMALGGK